MSTKLVMGTRGSLLAKTQSHLTAKDLETSSNNSIESKFITTQGDQQTDRALWQLEGKDFFTKELDQALLSEEVDFVVHSYKDLGSDRPEGIELCCVPERSYPWDILLMPKANIEKWRSKKGTLVVGTSSPRRQTNLKRSLKDYVPFPNVESIECKVLRGNVNTRIGKLRNGHYDAIVLAMAGLERLAHLDESRAILNDLVQGMDFMVLPWKDFTPAASQGALALEVKSSSRCKDALRKIHHNRTFDLVAKEREAFASFGGGCHLAVGIHCFEANGETIRLQKGEVDGRTIDSIEQFGLNLERPKKLFLGMQSGHRDQVVYDQYTRFDYSLEQCNLPGNLIVTSSHTFKSMPGPDQHPSIFAAGARTSRKLAKQGYWVRASLEGLSDQNAQWLAKSELLKVFGVHHDWVTLTSKDAPTTLGQKHVCYTRVSGEVQGNWEHDLLNCDSFYWTSFTQFELYVERWPLIRNKHHFCGLGKTLTRFQEANVAVTGLYHPRLLTELLD